MLSKAMVFYNCLKIVNSCYIYSMQFSWMQRLKKNSVFVLVWFLFASCGTVQRGTIPWEDTALVEGSTAITTINMSRYEQSVRSKLDLAYKDWKGTKYLLGGTGRRGIDCSGFIQVVFKNYFDVSLPRTTRQQMKLGSYVPKRNIKIGDLVFFEIEKDTYHVGVMINRSQFMHAGVSTGVTFSTLKNKYWIKRYLTARRIF